jgi:AAHS family 4-hydroxybenzoate transporter-like MFS transporter
VTSSPGLYAQAADGRETARLIDERPIGVLQMRVFALCALAVFAEGYDAQAIGFVAPVIAREWRLAPGALGPTFAAGVAGLALGAILIAPLADRLGRRPILLASSLACGVLTLATAFASGLTPLLALRFLTGLGLGGAMANAISLTAEYSPAKRRGAAVAIMFCGFALGAATAGAAAAGLIDVFGWRAVFFAGGVGTLLVTGVLAVWLPESLRFLALKGEQARIARLAPELAAIASSPPSMEPPQPGLAVIFQNGRAPITLLLWGVFFASLLDVYFLINWLPTTINAAGLSIHLAIAATTMLQIGGICGALTLGPFMDRFGPYKVLPLANLAAAVCIVAIGLAGASAPLTLLSAFGAGVAVIGCQNCNQAVAASLYSTPMRAHGIGAAHAAGRLGSIAGPLIGGAALAAHIDVRVLMVFSALPMIIAAACMVGLGVATRRAAAETLALF